MCPGFLKRLMGSRDEDDAPQPGTAPAGASFRERVERFWDWYESQSERLHGEVQSGGLDPGSFAAAVERAELGLAWEFCKGDKVKEGFVLSGESDTTKCLLARFAVERGKERAALKEHWNLHHMKLPSDAIAGATIRLDGQRSFAFSEFLFSVDFDAEKEQLEIGVHHPLFGEIEDGARWHLTWLAIDNALGQSLVKAWVGPVEPLEEANSATRHGIDALRTQSRAALALHDLDPELDPLKTFSSYQRREQSNGDLIARGDVIAGTTRNIDTILELENEVDELEVTELGAALAYIAIPAAELGAPGESVDARSQLEDRLDAALRANQAGEVTGGATGEQYVYLDLLIFDEGRAIDTARKELLDTSSTMSAVLRYFSPSRAGEQVTVIGEWESPPPGFSS